MPTLADLEKLRAVYRDKSNAYHEAAVAQREARDALDQATTLYYRDLGIVPGTVVWAHNPDGSRISGPNGQPIKFSVRSFREGWVALNRVKKDGTASMRDALREVILVSKVEG